MKKPKFRVRIVANKIDLLPKDASMPRVKGWIAREAQLAGLDKIKIMDVFPISCRLAAVFFFFVAVLLSLTTWGVKTMAKMGESAWLPR